MYEMYVKYKKCGNQSCTIKHFRHYSKNPTQFYNFQNIFLLLRINFFNKKIFLKTQKKIEKKIFPVNL